MLKTLIPFTSYHSCWLIFKNITNELDLITDFVVNDFQIGQHRRTVDLGCGDGVLLSMINNRIPNPFEQMTLVDIDKKMLQNAKKIFKDIRSVDFKLEDINNIPYSFLADYDCLIVSHSLYFIDIDWFLGLIDSLTITQSLYIVILNLDSIVDSFWKESAVKYHKKLFQIHRIITSISNKQYNVKKHEIISQIENPLLLPDDQAISILSLLSYKQVNDYNTNFDYYRKIIESSSKDDIVYHNTTLFKITKN